jgi:hypothetical protein
MEDESSIDRTQIVSINVRPLWQHHPAKMFDNDTAATFYRREEYAGTRHVQHCRSPIFISNRVAKKARPNPLATLSPSLQATP